MEKANVTFTENGHIDVAQLNSLYRAIGWDSHHRRTEHDTAAMLSVSHYYISATKEDVLVGFARVCGDPYVAQVLDVITHPEHRRCGIATGCMRGVLAHIRKSSYLSVTLTSDRSMAPFYRQFDFSVLNEVTLRWSGS